MTNTPFMQALLLTVLLGSSGCGRLHDAPIRPAAATSPYVLVQIDYGNQRKPNAEKVPLVPGQSAYDILHQVADVESTALGSDRMVTAINGVNAIEGQSFWIYNIDGKPAQKSANTLYFHKSALMTWRYTWNESSHDHDGTSTATSHNNPDDQP